MIKIILISVFLMAGCATTGGAEASTSEKIGVLREVPMFGTMWGCAKKQVEYGFTKEECGDMWGMELEIIYD